MAEQAGKMETSLPHTKEATTANKTKAENDLKTAEQATYTWWNREDHVEEGKGVEPWSAGIQALSPSQPTSDGRERNTNKHWARLIWTLQRWRRQGGPTREVLIESQMFRVGTSLGDYVVQTP